VGRGSIRQLEEYVLEDCSLLAQECHSSTSILLKVDRLELDIHSSCGFGALHFSTNVSNVSVELESESEFLHIPSLFDIACGITIDTVVLIALRREMNLLDMPRNVLLLENLAPIVSFACLPAS